MPTPSAANSMASTTIAALAEQLRDGPLKCLAALQVRTTALAANDEGSDPGCLEHLEEMVRLAQCAMGHFHEFTNELRALVEHVAARSADPH